MPEDTKRKIRPMDQVVFTWDGSGWTFHLSPRPVGQPGMAEAGGMYVNFDSAPTLEEAAALAMARYEIAGK